MGSDWGGAEQVEGFRIQPQALRGRRLIIQRYRPRWIQTCVRHWTTQNRAQTQIVSPRPNPSRRRTMEAHLGWRILREKG